MSDKKNWSSEETKVFLHIIEEKQILAMMDNKKHRNSEIFKIVEKEFRNAGYTRDCKQLEIKFKNLKQSYNIIKAHNAESGNNRKEHEFQDILDRLFQRRPREAFHRTHGLESSQYRESSSASWYKSKI
uniref:Myb/SANT-like DNA-binding domain-containing protein n=1 Tax=Phlebotomus papatasi TaxID=29031 RepID=A0A1B0DHP7_PHLPP